MVVYERGTRATPDTTREAAGGADVIMRRTVGRGRTLYLNLTPLAYSHFPFRSSTIGAAWRQVMGPALLDAGCAHAWKSIVTTSGSRGWNPCCGATGTAIASPC